MLAGIVLIALLALPGVGIAHDLVVPLTERIEGLTQSDYVVRWWQWANQRPEGDKPYQDPTGSQCGLDQSGDVWFLAGTDGTDEVLRHCTVPVGKYIFLPVINMLGHSVPGFPISCGQAKATAAANNEHLADAQVLVDGQAIPDVARYRVRSPDCFDAFLNVDALCQCECKQCTPASFYPAASDGYWLMLRPLALGPHRIKVKARYDNPGSELGDLEQVFEYQLQVERKATPKKMVETPDSVLAIK